MSEIGYVFECPVHGQETVVFCFRAFDESMSHIWKRMEITLTPVDNERGLILVGADSGLKGEQCSKN